MPLWDAALEDIGGTVREDVRTLGSAVQAFTSSDDLILADILPRRTFALDRVRDPHTAPNGFYGHGLWMDRGGRPRPAAFVQPGLAPPGGAPLLTTSAGNLLQRTVPTLPQRAVAIPLPPPQLLVDPLRAGRRIPITTNMHVTIGSQRATLGLPVASNDCDHAILTAGHAAPQVPILVRDAAGDRYGTVQRSLNLTTVGPGEATADVALVCIDPSRRRESLTLQTTVSVARQGDDVQLAGRTTSQSTWVRGLSPSFALTKTQGAWGEVAITASGISVQGDSGAIVVSTAGAVVGQIVAGYGSAYSLVQDAEYVLTAIDAHIR